EPRRDRPARHGIARDDRRRHPHDDLYRGVDRLGRRPVRVLVVGGTEFVSLHVVRALQREGHEAAVLNRGRRPERIPAGLRAVLADRTQHAALAPALAGQEFDAVYDVAYAPTTGED